MVAADYYIPWMLYNHGNKDICSALTNVVFIKLTWFPTAAQNEKTKGHRK